MESLVRIQLKAVMVSNKINLLTLITFFLNANSYKLIKYLKYKKTIIFLNENIVFTFLMFLKLNINISNTTLIDIFGYNVLNINSTKTIDNLFYNNIVIRNFFINSHNINLYAASISKKKFFSIESLFINSSWMERECSEMLDLFFFNKYDNRNLLLQYWDTNKPLIKSNPSIGNFEIFFNFLNNNIIRYNIINS